MSCVISKLRLKFTVKRRFGRRCPKIYQATNFFIQSELFIMNQFGLSLVFFLYRIPSRRIPAIPGIGKTFFTIIPDCITVNLLLILFDQSIFKLSFRPGMSANILLFHWIPYSTIGNPEGLRCKCSV